eukprot:TRINITY_DN15604_c0_g1_i1.p1 TRINITY_DN15604_c0_g1~~TRINITY_DN15604_c0_g1_i1.p1  ORF type:complete len:155 (+),score=30.78 TRINITY_DN15604_c0_g1_i1:50-466(+)
MAVHALLQPWQRIEGIQLQSCPSRLLSSSKRRSISPCNAKSIRVVSCKMQASTSREHLMPAGGDLLVAADGVRLSRRDLLVATGSTGMVAAVPLLHPRSGEAAEERSVYDFMVPYQEEDTSLSTYKNMVSVVLNVASA